MTSALSWRKRILLATIICLLGGCAQATPTVAPTPLAATPAPQTAAPVPPTGAPIPPTAPPISVTPTLAPSSSPAGDGVVNGWAVLAEKDNYDDVRMTNLPIGYTNTLQLRQVLLNFGWQASRIREVREFDQASLRQSLEWLAKNADADDIALLYVAAHGKYMSDVVKWSDFIAADWAAVPSQKRVLVMDTCQAGALTTAVKGDSRPYVSIAAVAQGELGWSGLEEEKLPIIGGVFTHFLAAALNNPQADADGNGQVSIQEAARLSEAQQRAYMHDVVLTVPQFLEGYHKLGSYPERDANFPHVIVDDTIGQPVYLRLKAASAGRLGDTQIRSADKMAMVYVPAGEFKMGSDDDGLKHAQQMCKQYGGQDAVATCKSAAFADEQPAHLVTLDEFWIDRTEVTNKQYRQCVDAKACTPPVDTSSYTRKSYYGNAAYDNYPVVWVNQQQAADYCRWAGARLPTEAEWEYAARGPEDRIFPWGNTFDGKRLNYCDVNCTAGPNDPTVDDGYADTAPVGSFPTGVSWCGTLDLAGNVREWVADYYGRYPSRSEVNPTGPISGTSRIPRGGCWLDTPDDARSTNRGGNSLDYTRHKVGFRCAGGATDNADAIAKEWVAAKLEAMKARDIQRYLALIDDTDPEYYTEQRNWFLIYQDAVTSDFTIEVVKADKISDGTIIASLRQHYLYGPEKADRTVAYEERLVKTPSGWKDADINYKIKQTAHFVVKYQGEVEANAIEVCEEAEKAYASVVKELGLEPHDKTTLKLFADQELLRQNTDIRVAYLFNGWAEDGESIKMYARRERAAIAPLVAHELTHKITLGITDSLNSWLAEGLAVYFGNQPFRSGNALHMGWFTAEELSKPITWLEENTLIQMTDQKMIGMYNSVSALVVEFIAETYGRDRIRDLLAELSKYPRYDRGFDYDKMELENQKRLHQAIKTVLGVNMDTLDQQWQKWINSQKG